MTPDEPLRTALRRRTADAHAGAERSPFLVAVVEGRVGRPGLAALLGRLAVVYAALEQTGRRLAGDAVVGPFLLPGLARGERLAQDLQALDAEPVPSPAARAYAERVQAAGASPVRYLAHHYTRCLADLSGGQVLRAGLERAGLPVSFFVPDLPPGPTRQRYRALLDALPLAAAEREELVEEVLLAYRLNVALTDELDAAPGLREPSPLRGRAS